MRSFALRSFVDRLSQLSRGRKVAIQIAMDSTLIFLAFALAMSLRLESFAFVLNLKGWVTTGISAAVCVFLFCKLGLYRTLVRYSSGRVLSIVSKGVIPAAVVMLVLSQSIDAQVPRSVPIIFAVLAITAIGCVRLIAGRLILKLTQSRKTPVIIYGAGEAGVQLMNALNFGQEYEPVGLIDDKPGLHKMAIGGVTVYDPDQIQNLVESTGARIVLLAIPSASRSRRREIINYLNQFQVEVKTIPGMADIISGKAAISELRTVSAEDLLGRDPVPPLTDLLRSNIARRVVMVTGAGGSIGSELCRKVILQEPTTIILFESSEFALYSIGAELRELSERRHLSVKIVEAVGSVQDTDRVKTIITQFGVNTIYHAAAYKHVPLVEDNPIEGIRNNVFGTQAVATAAKQCGVDRVILVSTDKAVRPTNVMGASKRLAELIFQAHAETGSKTVFTMVRFGNVLGSSGSVIPQFQAQIAKGGPVTVTHEAINRYFMTIPEAAQLVIQAGAMAEGGDVFVLDMGEPVKIMDLAISMIRLHGLVPYSATRTNHNLPTQGDIQIKVVGLRKGEKLYEELLIGNNPTPTRHPRIMTASEVMVPLKILNVALYRLMEACDNHDYDAVFSILKELPLAYSPADTGAPQKEPAPSNVGEPREKATQPQLLELSS